VECRRGQCLTPAREAAGENFGMNSEVAIEWVVKSRNGWLDAKG
jgi:hypothetical protein